VTRLYKKPPLVEALCEFQFEPSASWDLVIPGLIYEKVRSSFPNRRPSKILNFSVLAAAEAVQQQVQAADRIQFWSDDEKALIQLGPNILTVNHLQPYPSWAVFFPMIEHALNVYHEVAKPQRIARLSLRYINHIVFLNQPIELEDYFNFYPFVGVDLPQTYGSFFVGAQFPFENNRDLLQLQISNLSVQPPTMVLDLNYQLALQQGMPVNGVLDWVNNAHNYIEKTFEASITDHLRRMFEVKE